MIHVDAIEDALDQADVREIERAFRALVGFPYAEEIGGFAPQTKAATPVIHRGPSTETGLPGPGA